MGQSFANMAVGKNKRLTKGKKGSKKKIIDAFATKDWYEVKAPSIFSAPICGKTLVSRSKGTKLSGDALKGRVLEMSLGDLNKNEDDAYRKIRLRVEDAADVKTVDGYVLRCFCIGFIKKRPFQIRKTS